MLTSRPQHQCFASHWPSSSHWPAPTSYCSARHGASVTDCISSACAAHPTAVTSYSSLSASVCARWASCSAAGSTGVYTISAPGMCVLRCPPSHLGTSGTSEQNDPANMHYSVQHSPATGDRASTGTADTGTATTTTIMTTTMIGTTTTTGTSGLGPGLAASTPSPAASGTATPGMFSGYLPTSRFLPQTRPRPPKTGPG